MGDFDDEALGRVYGLRGMNGGKGQGRSTAHPESETRVLGIVVGEMGKYVEARGLVKNGLEPLFLDITRCILTAPKLDSMCIRVGHVIATLRDDSLSAEGRAALVELKNHCGPFPSEEDVAEFAQETRGRVKGRDKNREELGPFTVLEEQCMCPAFVVPMKGGVADEVANTTLQMGDAVYSLMSGTPVRTAAAGVYLDYRPPLLGLPGCHGAAQLLLSLLNELVGCSFARYREVGSGQRVTIELFDTKFNIWRRRGASQPIQLLVRDLVLRGMYDQANIPIREGGAPVVVAKPDMSMDGVPMLRGVPRDKQLMMLSAGNAANKFMKRIQNISKHILPDLQKILDLILHLDPATDKNQAKILAEILDLHITFKPKAEGMVAPLFVAKNRVSKEVVLESFRSGFSDNDIPRIIEAFRRNNDIITEADIKAYYAPPAAAAAAAQPASSPPAQPGSPPGASAAAAAAAPPAPPSGTGTPQGKSKNKKH